MVSHITYLESIFWHPNWIKSSYYRLYIQCSFCKKFTAIVKSVELAFLFSWNSPPSLSSTDLFPHFFTRFSIVNGKSSEHTNSLSISQIPQKETQQTSKQQCYSRDSHYLTRRKRQFYSIKREVEILLSLIQKPHRKSNCIFPFLISIIP